MPGRILIVGAGLAGLGASIAAKAIGASFLVLEAESRPGGLGRTDEIDGFRFDRAGHVLHFRSSEFERTLRKLGVRLAWVERQAAVLVGDTVVPYPLQYNLHAFRRPSLVASLLADLANAASAPSQRSDSFADALASAWGHALVDLFFRPYNEKLWGRPLENLPPDCAGPYLPPVDVALAVEGASRSVSYAGYHRTFAYPSSGRLADVADALAAEVDGRISYEEELVGLDLDAHEAHTSVGRVIPYDLLISTAPLDRLVERSGLDGHGQTLFDATALVNVRIGLRGAMRTNLHWLYVPAAEIPVHRIGFPWNVSRRTCPAGCVSLSAEYTIPLRGPRRSTAELAGYALEVVESAGLVDVCEVVHISEALVSPAYVVHRAPGRRTLSHLIDLLAERDVRVAGRFGAWDYLSLEEAFLSGTRTIPAGPVVGHA